MGIADPKSMGRRRALIRSGAALGGLAALGLTPRADAAAAKVKWDHETDLVCVGSGAAACAAAVTAVSRGARAIIVEKLPITGGTTGKSGGVVWIPNNVFLRQRGIDDDKRDCLRYMARYAFPRDYVPDSPTLGLAVDDYRRLEAYYDNASPAVELLEKLGAARFQEFRLPNIDRIATDYADHLPENKVPRGRALESTGGLPLQGGRTLADGMIAWLRGKGAPVLVEHAVTRVIKDGDRVVGVEALHGDRVVRIRARRGVVFGTGGYAHGVELIKRYQPGLYGSCATLGSTGDFIPIAEETGARMGVLSNAFRTQVVLEEAIQNRALAMCAFQIPGDSMVVVNRLGKRIVNEKLNYQDRTPSHFTWEAVGKEFPAYVQFMVFDERSMDAFGGAFPIPADRRNSRFVIQGGSFEELAEAIQVRLAKISAHTGDVRLAPDFATTLRDTVDRFNGFARSGRDLDFDRGRTAYDVDWHEMSSPMRAGSAQPRNTMPNLTMHPIAATGPYYAVILGPGALDTCGGPMVNEHAQVLDARGKPIPGLYGAGNCISAPTRAAYFGAGATIGPALTFGYLAALHAVAAGGKA